MWSKPHAFKRNSDFQSIEVEAPFDQKPSTDYKLDIQPGATIFSPGSGSDRPEASIRPIRERALVLTINRNTKVPYYCEEPRMLDFGLCCRHWLRGQV
jgi:hypothetical protein